MMINGMRDLLSGILHKTIDTLKNNASIENYFAATQQNAPNSLQIQLLLAVYDAPKSIVAAEEKQGIEMLLGDEVTLQPRSRLVC
jgi:hypothetical protein